MLEGTSRLFEPELHVNRSPQPYQKNDLAGECLPCVNCAVSNAFMEKWNAWHNLASFIVRYPAQLRSAGMIVPSRPPRLGNLRNRLRIRHDLRALFLGSSGCWGKSRRRLFLVPSAWPNYAFHPRALGAWRPASHLGVCADSGDQQRGISSQKGRFGSPALRTSVMAYFHL